jgi:hypothetical protein
VSGMRVPPMDRLHQARRLLRTEGASGLLDRARSRLATVVAPSRRPLLVSDEEFERAAEVMARGNPLPEPLPWIEGQPLDISFICSPPLPGAGGHTTIFRIIAALEQAGHNCTVYLHNLHGSSTETHIQRIRSWWPWMKAEIADVNLGLRDSHAIFATGWETAYVLLGSKAQGVRCYLVQDFEPLFTPAGTTSLLAEGTYRFGFIGITAGRWLAEMLSKNYGMTTSYFDFGCDPEEYRYDADIDEKFERSGICYYCRPITPRRAHELAVKSLELFHRDNPSTEIHFFGHEAKEITFPITHHGLLDPASLGRLYNRTLAGLVLSATNVSLVPLEMLSAGCIPVMNDAEHNRIVLQNCHVRYADPTPFALAAQLTAIVRQSEVVQARTARLVAEDTNVPSWASVGSQFDKKIRAIVATQTKAKIKV